MRLLYPKTFFLFLNSINKMMTMKMRVMMTSRRSQIKSFLTMVH